METQPTGIRTHRLANRRPANVLLSVVIPVYNERTTILKLLAQVQAVDIPMEIIVVDDFSTDGTRDILKGIHSGKVRIFFHEKNRGKGAALRTGFSKAKGDLILVQDADLEYDPSEYCSLIAPILDGKADVVFGSRFMGGRPHRVLFFWHSVANRFLTLVSNMITDLNLTDMETCYKVFRAEALQRFEIEEDRFGFEPEITVKLARLGLRFYEVGITYNGRGYGEGKKIGPKDALRALYCLLKYGLFRKAFRPLGALRRSDLQPIPSNAPEPEHLLLRL